MHFFHRRRLDYKESLFIQETWIMNLAQADLNITNDVIHLRLTDKAFHICFALHWNVLFFVFSEALRTLRSPLSTGGIAVYLTTIT